MWIILSIFLAFVLYIIWKYWALILGAGFDPTPMKTVRRMLEIAEIDEKDIVYDLGCGDGRVILTAARDFGSKSVGIEADPLRFLYARLRVFFSKERNRIKVIFGNFMNKDIGNATCVVLFLFTRGNDLLLPKFKRELKPGTKIISYTWRLSEWQTVKTDAFEEIYLYVIPKPHKQSV